MSPSVIAALISAIALIAACHNSTRPERRAKRASAEVLHPRHVPAPARTRTGAPVA